MSTSASQPLAPHKAREELVATAMTVPAVLALIVGIVDYVNRGSGIQGTPGALLVIGASLVLAVTAFAVGRIPPSAWRTTLIVLILIGAALTALAAWFLESALIIACMAVMAAIWAVFIMVAR